MILYRRAFKVGLALSALAAMFALLSWANYTLIVRPYPGGNDFLARWTGAHYWITEGMNPYDEQVSRIGQQMIYGRPVVNPMEDQAHFAYPLYSMIFFALPGLLPFPVARAVWMSVLEFCLMGLALLGLGLANWRPRPWLFGAVMLFSLLWYHSLRAVIVGQFAALDAFLIVLALWAVKTRRDELAGILLALSTSKPQMPFLIIPFILIWALGARRWKIILWSAGSMALLLALSFALIPSWLGDFLGQVRRYTDYTDIGSPVSILSRWLLPGQSAALELVLTLVLIAYLLNEWRRAWGQGDEAFQWTAALTLTVTNLVAFRTATTHYPVLLPGLFLVFKHAVDRSPRAGLPLVLGSMAVLFIGLWALFFVTVAGRIEQPPMYLPVPLALLAGLIWVRVARLAALVQLPQPGVL